MNGSVLSCLPYAHILGVSKCGTTDLYARLAIHPRLLPSANKGPHFWDGPQSLAWYIGLYADGAARMQAGAAPADSIYVDASSNTLTYAGVGVRQRRAPKPPVTLPQVLAWLQPDVRLIVMFREPAARYYSAYNYYDRRYRIYARRFGPTGPAAFAAMVGSDLGAFMHCRLTATARRCARSLFEQVEQLAKGLYAIFLEPWLTAFPSEQMLILRLDDYEYAPAAHLRTVLAFLSLNKPPRSMWRRMMAQPRANRHAPGREPALIDTHRQLRTFYAEYNEQLAHMIGEPAYLEWNRDLDADRAGAMSAATAVEARNTSRVAPIGRWGPQGGRDTRKEL